MIVLLLSIVLAVYLITYVYSYLVYRLGYYVQPGMYRIFAVLLSAVLICMFLVFLIIHCNCVLVDRTFWQSQFETKVIYEEEEDVGERGEFMRAKSFSFWCVFVLNKCVYFIEVDFLLERLIGIYKWMLKSNIDVYKYLFYAKGYHFQQVRQIDYTNQTHLKAWFFCLNS